MTPAQLAWLTEHRKRERKASYVEAMTAAVYTACHIAAQIPTFGSGHADTNRNNPYRVLTKLGLIDEPADKPKPTRDTTEVWNSARKLKGLLASARKKGVTDPVIDIPDRGPVSIAARLKELDNVQ